ncbi:UDP-N-acetylmuramoyl-tripeptide--D-alanyl-D-alanine ligase [Bacillus ectoiniformans]|uniref:YheC/YheD family protein n=1 Tax=Bacillus ectoiniformans TaxID=1494429 RepID=UPI00195BBA69|nr:YheC/YheD family protein [Bacillus ectoiniformans]MBM7648228.1 UDP-N-acetylmuramoyl-tripeptide--D-alanyl-D-alanine ligase [Bacillus ectoiniformans]
MIRIGMLHHRKDPRTVLKSYAYAAVAKAEGADFFYFSPRKVNFLNRTIHAYVLEDGDWVQKTVPFPDVIYNTGSPMKLSRSKQIVEKLKAEIPFTTHSIGNKWSVQRRLTEAKEFDQYLLPTEEVKDFATVLTYLQKYEKAIFKPKNGRKGQSIHLLECLADNQYLVKKDDLDSVYTKDQFQQLIKDSINREPFLIQPYIESVTKSGAAFDFRLHLQKDGNGKWVVTTIYPRIAPEGSIISNINNGGYTNYLEPFLKQEYGDDAFNMKRTLEHFSLSLAEHLDQLQYQYYEERLDELGFDVGVDKNQRLWVYEVNWRPGCPPAFYLELDVVKLMIQYAMYLAKEHKKGEEEPVKKLTFDRPIIGITGSAGKTTTKAFLASILKTRLTIFDSKDNWNTTDHTRQHAEEINDSHEAVVLEYAMAYPGVIKVHCEIIQPNISIITNIGLAHVGNFDSDIKGVAAAKSEIIHGMDPNGWLVLNADDDNSRFLETENFKGVIRTVGIHKSADYQAKNVTYGEKGMEFEMKLHGVNHAFKISMFGEHNVYNALSAIATADMLGFTASEIKEGLESFHHPVRRMRVYPLPSGVTMIDDTIHAHPPAVKAAIDVMKHIAKGRKVALLGRMPELGDKLEEEYQAVGRYAVDNGVDFLISYGYRADEIRKGALEAGLPEDRNVHFSVFEREECHALLQEILEPGDTILIKGASRLSLTETVQFLKQNQKEK